MHHTICYVMYITIPSNKINTGKKLFSHTDSYFDSIVERSIDWGLMMKLLMDIF